MRMDKYSNAAYGSAGLTAFFASLSLYEWGFIIGMAFSIILGLATFFMNRREQRKRTRLFEELVNKTDPQNPSATARKAAELIAQQWFNVLLATRGVPANKDGEARALMVIAGAVTKAINNGTILAGKTLSDVQKLAIADASGDDLAWYDVQDKGYWYNAQIVENTGESDLPEYVMKYVLIYGKGDWVRKVEGSHNLV